jgi:DNA repair exonuclease SbcCD ATPase subunit
MSPEELRRRLERLEQKVHRNYRHLESVILSQRERVDQSFDQARLSIVQVEASLRQVQTSFGQVQASFGQVQAALTAQGEALENHAAETRDSIQELVEMAKSLEDRQNPPAA